MNTCEQHKQSQLLPPQQSFLSESSSWSLSEDIVVSVGSEPLSQQGMLIAKAPELLSTKNNNNMTLIIFTFIKIPRKAHYLKYICISFNYVIVHIIVVSMRILVLAMMICFCSASLKGQDTQELEVYNMYISFLNECTHGLAIAKTLLDNNNKELNRYIDLPSANSIEINNDDLPSNYFDKPDDDSEFYTISPIELSVICKAKSSALNSSTARQLNGQVDNIVNILNQINQIRFDLESYTDGHDLNEKESIYGVYEYLEKAVKLFNDYADAHKRLANDINDRNKSNGDPLHAVCYAIHSTTKSILRNMRRENQTNVINDIFKLNNDLKKFNDHVSTNKGEYSSKDAQYYIKTIDEKTAKVIQLVRDYENPGYVPVELELYGKHYYYHNQLLSKYFNFTGPGFVRDMNKLLEDLGKTTILLDEEPLLFKVIYPVKIQEATTLNTTKTIVEKPKVVIENNLEFSEVKPKDIPDITLPPTPIATTPPAPKVTYDNNLLILEIYDYSMLDRDSVSVAFNGKVILDHYTLRLLPETINLELNPNGPNILTVTAHNDGMMAPNTPSISYRRSGQRKKVKLKPSLRAQEVFEIEIE